MKQLIPPVVVHLGKRIDYATRKKPQPKAGRPPTPEPEPEKVRPAGERLPPPKLQPWPHALQVLGDRVRCHTGMHWLDGVPCKMDKIIREANRVLKKAGQPLIEGVEAWKP